MAGHFDPAEKRDRRGRWTAVTVPHTDVRVGDRLGSSGKTRISKVHRVGDRTLIQTRVQGSRTPSAQRLSGDVTVYRQGHQPITASDLSSGDARRSPEVSPAEFQAHASRGEAKYAALDKHRTGAMAMEGARFKRITDDAYAASREPWGGVTVDSHTGEHVDPKADAYALSIRKPGVDSVSVSPTASREEFDNAMDEARQRFAHELEFAGAHLGVFHDADLNRIDIDPVLVTPSLEDVHDIGAYTRALGGAYHFKSGDGFWPPHVRSNKMDLSIVTPAYDGDFDLSGRDGKVAFWKQILPMKRIHYTAKDGTRQQMDFNAEYLRGLAKAAAVDSVGFLLADKDNRHTMDPERWRGKVAAFEVREDGDPEQRGLWGKIVFPSTEAAKAVLDNPELGVSARIRPNVEKSDGTTVPAGIIHVLGTLDPQVSGMSPWQPADLSNDEPGDVLDLSDEEYEDMADEDKFANLTVEDIDSLTEEDLDAFLESVGVDLGDYTGDRGDQTKVVEDAKDDSPREPALAGAGADMSRPDGDEIDLARQAVIDANARANEALRRVADAEWRSTRDAYLREGVPAYALDLAAPVLNRADDMVIDLSHFGEDDVDVSKTVRGLLDALKGTVDLSAEEGHNGVHSGGENPDQAVLDRWVMD